MFDLHYYHDLPQAGNCAVAGSGCPHGQRKWRAVDWHCNPVAAVLAENQVFQVTKPQEDQIEQWLDHWEECTARGQELDLELLCQEYPECLDELPNGSAP